MMQQGQNGANGSTGNLANTSTNINGGGVGGVVGNGAQFYQTQNSNSSSGNLNLNGLSVGGSTNSASYNSLNNYPFIRKRRDAVRLLKVHESNGHQFLAKFFSQPTFCSFCAEFLWYIYI
jgi:hypothetical protein